jgi:hypothetical protein
MDVKTTFRNLVRDQSVSICMLHYYFVTLFDFLSLKNDLNVPSKIISRKNCVKIFFFLAGILKVNDKNSRIRIQDPDPDSDPLVRAMVPRIRIHPKMSWIRNTD